MTQREFLNVLRVILNVFELLASVMGFMYWHKIKKSYWRWFSIYLIIVVVIEVIGYYSMTHGRGKFNNSLYQFFAMPLQFIFFCWLFYKNFLRQWQRVAALSSIVVFLIFWLDEILSKEKSPYWFISLSYDAGVIVLLVLIMIFLIKMSTTDEILNFKTNIMFWVVMGLFAGYICTIPYYIWRNYLITYEKSKPELLYVPFYVFMFLNYLMYSLFCVGFIKWKQAS